MSENTSTKTKKKDKFSKEEWSWIMYDWANSGFATIFLAAIFPIFFTEMAGGAGSLGDAWWGFGNTASRIFLAILAPLLGAVIAYRGVKKKLFINLLAFGVLFHIFIVVQSSWQMLLLGYIFANMLWTAGNIVYDSYLSDVTSKERMDKVSAWGFALGYIGGSTIPFVISIVLIMFGGNFGIDMTPAPGGDLSIMAVRISIIITAVWWIVFSIPMLRNVHHKYPKEIPEKGLGAGVFQNAATTARSIAKNKPMLLFLIAYFFYIDGVGAVMVMATAYGTVLGLGAIGMIGALFVTQLVGVPFSILFGRLAKRFSSISLIAFAIVVYFIICVIGFIMGFGLELEWFDLSVAQIMFWALAFMVGTVQGGIQSTSRAIWGRLIPAEHSGEYFGFYEIYGRFAGIVGPTLYGILRVAFSPAIGILPIGTLFIIGFVILMLARNGIKVQLDKTQPQDG